MQNNGMANNGIDTEKMRSLRAHHQEASIMERSVYIYFREAKTKCKRTLLI